MIHSIFYVYVLRDPRNRKIHYVGQTANPKRRLIAHLSQIKAYRPSEKQKWIIALRSLNLRPLMEIVYQGDDLEIVTNVEQELIDRLSKKGEILYNRDGVKGRKNKKPVYY